MPNTPISAIIINPDRQRKELTGIEELARSLSQSGLINPIVVTESLELIAGERRLTAAKSIGWSHIPTTIFENLSEAERHLIELEENVQREALPWKDHTRAICQYHSLRKSQDPEWSLDATGDNLGMSKQMVSKYLMVNKALEDGDELVVKADKFSVAFGIVERKRQRQSADASNVIDQMADSFLPSDTTGMAEDGGAGGTGSPSPDHIGEGGDTLPSHTVPPVSVKDNMQFIHGEFGAHDFPDIKFNFLHCDFPYGVQANKHDQGAADKFGGYDDDPRVYWNLIDHLGGFTNSHVAESAHLMFWYSLDFHDQTVDALREMGWSVNPFPLIWHKTDNRGILPDPKRGPRRNYETALLCSRGDRFIVQAVSNIFGSATTKTIHMSEKHPDMLDHFFRMFVDDTTVMLDPTMGSGNAVACAAKAGAKIAVGLEREETFYEAAKGKHHGS